MAYQLNRKNEVLGQGHVWLRRRTFGKETVRNSGRRVERSRAKGLDMVAQMASGSSALLPWRSSSQSKGLLCNLFPQSSQSSVELYYAARLGEAVARINSGFNLPNVSHLPSSHT